MGRSGSSWQNSHIEGVPPVAEVRVCLRRVAVEHTAESVVTGVGLMQEAQAGCVLVHCFPQQLPRLPLLALPDQVVANVLHFNSAMSSQCC